MKELGRLVEGSETRKEVAAAGYAAEAAESAAWYAETLRCIEEDKEGHTAEKLSRRLAI